MDNEPLPLDLTPTEDLAEALARRFDALVIIGVANRSDAEAELLYEHFGCFPTCVGAATIALQKMMEEGDD